MEIRSIQYIYLASLLIWLSLAMGCAGHGHQHLDEPLPPPVYAAPETAQAMKEGNRYFKEGWWTGAEKQYRIAIQAFPSMAEAQYNLGLTLNKQGGRYQESRVYFKNALKLEPRNPVYRNAPPFRRYENATTKPEPEPDSDGHGH
jgi:tetratricopeptide (TPR) repeat protein